MKINLEIVKSAFIYDNKEIQNLNTKTDVPKMVFRRRLTRASKLIIELINTIEFKQGRIMYSSAFGELPATANILNAILNKEGISPTDFQNSVYNTPVSYSSILQKNETEIMTISSGDGSGEKLLKIGAVKALDGDEILLLATETMNIENIDTVNRCVDYLESAVALIVRQTDEKPTINTIANIDTKFPKSIATLIALCEKCSLEDKNIIQVEI